MSWCCCLWLCCRLCCRSRLANVCTVWIAVPASDCQSATTRCSVKSATWRPMNVPRARQLSRSHSNQDGRASSNITTEWHGHYMHVCKLYGLVCARVRVICHCPAGHSCYMSLWLCAVSQCNVIAGCCVCQHLSCVMPVSCAAVSVIVNWQVRRVVTVCCLVCFHANICSLCDV